MRSIAMKILKKIKRPVFGISMFFLTAYIPVLIMVYCPCWYKFICLFHIRCGKMSKHLVSKFISELTGFFLHRGELTTYWSIKEKIHLLEVRTILDSLAVLAVVFIVLFLLTLKKKNLLAQARLNVFITGSLIILIPFFQIFWESIFHPLLFDNNMWLNTPKDVSFYIMPGVFFKYSMVFFIITTIAINVIIWLFLRKKIYSGAGNNSADQDTAI